MSRDEVADGLPEGANHLRTTGDDHRTTTEQPAMTTEQPANNPEPSPNIAEHRLVERNQSETSAKTEPFYRDAAAILRDSRARAEREREEAERKPSNLLQYARKHAPSDGDERETRCAWIVRDEDAPAGEWWICKRCEVVLDSSAKVGAHSCIRRAPRRAAARRAQPSGARWWPFG